MGCTEKVEEVFMGNPSSSLNDFVFYHCNMCCRTAESDGAEFQEQERKLLHDRFLDSLSGVERSPPNIGFSRRRTL